MNGVRHGERRRTPCVNMQQLWGLATRWSGTRLSPDDARRPSPAEIVEIFAGLGLTGVFWDPQVDQPNKA